MEVIKKIFWATVFWAAIVCVPFVAQQCMDEPSWLNLCKLVMVIAAFLSSLHELVIADLKEEVSDLKKEIKELKELLENQK